MTRIVSTSFNESNLIEVLTLLTYLTSILFEKKFPKPYKSICSLCVSRRDTVRTKEIPPLQVCKQSSHPRHHFNLSQFQESTTFCQNSRELSKTFRQEV